jgi:hypothetical protein
MRVENVPCAAEKMGERLTIITVADSVVASFACYSVRHAL